MNAHRFFAAAAVAALLATSASAQTVVLKKRGTAAAGTGTVTVTRQGAETMATIKATNADAKALFQDIATKSGAKILLSPSVAGPVKASVDAQALETAIRSVAASNGYTVRKIFVPAASAPTLTAAQAGAFAGALSGTVTSATVVDPASGRGVTLTFSAAPKPGAEDAAVYYINRALTANATATDASEAAASASAILSQLPVATRMQAMRQMQQEMFQNMTQEDRDQMRQQMQQRGGPGGPGGQGGPPPGGFGGGPMGPPPDGDDGSMPPPM